MLAIVWNCTVANQYQQDKTIRMMGNEWHAHSVLKLRKKKNSKLNPQLPFGHVLFKSSFFLRSIDLPEWFTSELETANMTIRYNSQYSETLVVFRNESKEKAGSPLSDMWLNIQNPGC